MAEISYKSIFDGVTLALHEAFPDRQVYGGEVKQGLHAGDFNVVLPVLGHTQEVGERFKRTPVVDVIYYPRSGRAECLEIADQLTILLGSITTPEGDVVHGKIKECNTTDGVLHVLAEFDHFVYLQQEPIYMETLKIIEEG